MVEQRRLADEARRQKEAEMAAAQEVPTIVIKQRQRDFNRS